MPNLIYFICKSKKAEDISWKAGNLYLNRFCIDENAAFEISGIYYLEESPYNEAVIRTILQRSAETKSDTHIIIAGLYGGLSNSDDFFDNNVNKMNCKYLLITSIYMYRDLLVSRDKMKQICTGKCYRQYKHKTQNGGRFYQESVNDDLELMFESIQAKKRFEAHSWTYFLPELTLEELECVEKKDKYFFKKFKWSNNPDVDESEMKRQKSNAKYISAYCERVTLGVLSSTCHLREQNLLLLEENMV